jgi:CGNR zinc finger
VSRIASRDAAVVRVTGRLSRSDLLWVANTAHGPGGHWHARVRGGEPDHDHLESPEAAMRYLADHRVPVLDEPPDQVALAEMGVVRTMVHRLLWPGADPWTDEGRALLAAARYALDAEGRIACTQAGWRRFCRDLLVSLIALAENRACLRRCANPACRLLFEDGSPNHARRWCDTAGCGNRDRVRRARSRDAAAPTSRARPGASNP